ncbi:zinc finger MYM-type protein 1-like [Parasteatoda tepidariorum]|uniref:zinc finger MYM-type protein 1-like n=1 Tax=Parasteatoda tepidariorum TaxID=114398 RepID=UPI0039BC6C99
MHRESILKFTQRLKTEKRIDSAIIKQYQSEVHYWRSVLQRIVETVKFLSSRGMGFFGENETFGSTHNGNFLGCLELIAQFDPFLAKHIEKAGNQGTGNVNYLSSTIVNEFVELMGEKVLNVVIKEVIDAKYFSIIVDSTPDVTHMNQLTLILRYLGPDYEPVKRFIKFIQIFGHNAESLTNVILQVLEDLGLDIRNCRGQSYDNASNMAGKYSGVQARIKNINSTAEYVPCSAHSLNLVGINAVESCIRVVNFFSLLQELYNFFSVSTYRWQIMIDNFIGSKQKLTLKNRSCTRWCADANATKALRQNYDSVLKSLSYLADDQDQTPSTRNQR